MCNSSPYQQTLGSGVGSTNMPIASSKKGRPNASGKQQTEKNPEREPRRWMIFQSGIVLIYTHRDEALKLHRNVHGQIQYIWLSSSNSGYHWNTHTHIVKLLYRRPFFSSKFGFHSAVLLYIQFMIATPNHWHATVSVPIRLSVWLDLAATITQYSIHFSSDIVRLATASTLSNFPPI